MRRQIILPGLRRRSARCADKRNAPSLSAWLPMCLAGALLALPLAGQLHDERAVKVAYVFNLTKYVTWPRESGHLVVGFVGEGPMGEALQKMLGGKTSESRPIQILLSPEESELERCDVLYVAYSSPEKVHATLVRVRGKSVLTVGDTESFPRDGGMIGLVRSGEQVRLQVNLGAVQEAGLKISSRVLELATIVHSNAEASN